MNNFNKENSHRSQKRIDTPTMVIIGASGGIGRYLSRVYSERYRIIGTYFSTPPLQSTRSVNYYELNVCDSEEVTGLLNDIGPSLYNPIVIYTPGISPNNLATRIADEDWNHTIAVNLSGAMYVSRAIIPWMRKLNYGRIIFLSSVLSRIAVPGTLAYSVTKAGLCTMARVIAAENAIEGITVNTIALGYFDIGIIKAVPDAFLKDQVIPKIPLKHLGNPKNIVSAINFVIQSDYLTGSVIDLNGGLFSV